MQRVMLVLFIASELCFYLLIAQTGIVEIFNSDIYAIAPLPIGGILGSVLSYYINIKNKNKLLMFLSLQFTITLFYPNLSTLMLFILGLSVGAIAPLLINELKKATSLELGFALTLSYVSGTFLFNYDAYLRGDLAIGLTLIAIFSLIFMSKNSFKYSTLNNFTLSMMVLWVFLDSALFETLSRDLNIPIWRDGYSIQIALFHIIGVAVALKYKIDKNQQELLIITLFAVSYLLYFISEAFILSLVYPFVISYYNVVILQNILTKDLKTIAFYMIFIGWIASAVGLFVALEQLMLYVPIIFLIIFFKIIILQNNKNYIVQNKEVQNV